MARTRKSAANVPAKVAAPALPAAAAPQEAGMPESFDPDKLYQVKPSQVIQHGRILIRPSQTVKMRGHVAEQYRDMLLWATEL